jgi:hypothetical protein
MDLLTEITSFLAGIGFDKRIEGLQPLTQWQRPTAFRVFFGPGASLRSVVVKHIPDFQDTLVADLWRPRWKVAQDYINLCFLEKVTTGGFAPRVYGYSQERNMLAIEDVGQTSLRDITKILGIGTDSRLWQKVCRVLAQLTTTCPPDPDELGKFAHEKLPTFAVLEKWNDQKIVGVAREMGFSHVDELEDKVTNFQSLLTQSPQWIGYSVGDLWHQHVMFHNGHIRFIDFHCGGYDILVTDLMRLIQGTPLYQDEPLPDDLVVACQDAFFAELCRAQEQAFSRQEFDQVYDFVLLRHAAFMVGREIIQLRRKNHCALVTRAVQNIHQHLKNSGKVNAVVLDFVTELEKFPNRAL